MKAHQASWLNAAVLMGCGLWAYFGSSTPSNTALIPVGIGAALLTLNRGVKRENKISAHVAVLLTLLMVGGLVKPLLGALDRGDNLAIGRVAAMLATTLLALLFFIKSFVDVRRARKKKVQLKAV